MKGSVTRPSLVTGAFLVSRRATKKHARSTVASFKLKRSIA
jgi:hypothetical protein